jgi:hypothetical protein
MQLVNKVYMITFTGDDSNPFIQYDMNTHIDWILVSECLNGTRSMSEYTPIEIVVKHKDANKCDFYGCSGSYGLLSKKAIDLLGDGAVENYQTLPAKLNGEDFSLLYCKKETDCFDRQNSKYVEFDEPSKFLLSIEKYAFYPDKIDANCIFSIPESNRMFCSQVLASTIENQLQGFRLIELFSV